MKKHLITSTITLAALAGASHAATLSLDFQPTGVTPVAGFEAFGATNQDAAAGASAMYSAFGTTVTVTLATSNLPDGALDFRVVTRNGTDTATNVANDWIGVDTRNTGVDVTMTITLSGLPAGQYNWLSGHHDGGGAQGTGNGNIQGLADFNITDATGSSNNANAVNLTRNDTLTDTPDPFSYDFTSDGSDVVVDLVMDINQGDVGDTNAIFIHMNSLAISEIPEPSAGILAGLGLVGLLRRRR